MRGFTGTRFSKGFNFVSMGSGGDTVGDVGQYRGFVSQHFVDAILYLF